jgi:fructokinase
MPPQRRPAAATARRPGRGGEQARAGGGHAPAGGGHAPAGGEQVRAGGEHAPAGAGRPRRVLCLGDPLLDLICERQLPDPLQADAFVPHPGGAVANIAALAARAGVQVALAGATGADDWGRWLRERLQRAGVETSLLELVAGRQTSVALVTVDTAGEPSWRIYGADHEAVAPMLDRRLEEAVRDSGALLIGSNSLVGERGRELTMRARQLALEQGRHVIFDPNLRLHRWRSRADAQASANACVPGALLVRANLAEAQLMTGEEDVERAALALVKAGARMVVISLGARGALLRGELRADAGGVQARVLSTIGAGDALTATLLQALARTGFYPPAVAASLRDGVLAGARACERWGALE